MQDEIGTGMEGWIPVVGALGGAFLGGLFTWLGTRTTAEAAYDRERNIFWIKERHDKYLILVKTISDFREELLGLAGEVRQLWIDPTVERDKGQALFAFADMHATVNLYASSTVRDEYYEARRHALQVVDVDVMLDQDHHATRYYRLTSLVPAEIGAVVQSLDSLIQAIRADLQIPD